MSANRLEQLKSFDSSSRARLLEIIGTKAEAVFFAEAQSIAEQAGQKIIDEVLRRGMSVVVENSNEKSDGSPVSEIDLLAHSVLAKGLCAISDFPLVSEEDPAGPLGLEKIGDGNFFWLADPLDGTRDFLAGEKTFAVALSLMRKASSDLEAQVVGHARGYWGTIVDPSERRSWAASRFQRLAKRIAGQPVAVSRDFSERPIRILGSRSIPSHRMEQLYRFWGSNDVTRMGSAIKFALIAEGLYDVYPRFGPTSEWDTAAGQILLEAESGGLYSLLTGEPMQYGKKSWSNGGFLAARTNELLETWTPRMRLHQT